VERLLKTGKVDGRLKKDKHECVIFCFRFLLVLFRLAIVLCSAAV